uniref:Putative E3 ubiquitin-protein ligase XBOS34 n=1 Tax=Anthurium amnicola TaxID=1678845 RepID=A0A1D1XL17_9ARAE
MGAQTSKEEQLYQQVNYGNVHGIQHLRREGAGLEFIDKEGKTPLIVACMRPDLLPVAKCLIDLGANVNAYRPGCHAGAPLHHAAKRGLEQTVNLLLSHGANPSVTNDDCLTPLDLARAKGHINVVRAIETHMRLFSGWIRELYGPGFLEVLAPQWASRKIWAVVLPCDHRNPMNPAKFELVIYPELQVAQPRTTIALWKAKIEEPNFSQPDPMLVIVDKNSRSRFRFLAANEGDKQQLLSFYNACRGMREVNCPHPAIPATAQVPPLLPNAVISTAAANAPTVSEDMELAMAINASIQSAMIEGISPLSDVRPLPQLPCTNDWASSDNATHNGWGSQDVPSSSSKINNGWTDEPANDAYNGWVVPEPARSTNLGLVHESQHYTSDVTPVLQNTEAVSHPSAPPITEAVFDDGPILYPSVDSSPVDFKLPDVESRPGTSETKEGSGGSSSCVICLDAPVEGACIPCGHMAGCMSCLNEIKKKKWGCPVCRANIDQVIKLFAV